MAKKTSKKGKGSYAKYKSAGRQITNKKLKVARHVRNNPNDKQAAALESKTFSYKRKTPHSRTWKRSKSTMAHAHILSSFGYSGSQIMAECFPRPKASVAKDKKTDE